MADLESLTARYAAGESISFGPHVALAEGRLHLPGSILSLDTLEELRVDGAGNVVICGLGWDEPLALVPAAEIEDVDRFVRATNHWIQAIPYVRRRSKTGWPPGSIGDASARIGTDVRDLLMAGYTDEQIQGLLQQDYTLDELYKQRPRGRSTTGRGPNS